MRIPTYNVNGINGRLANLLDWLRDTAPDIACLQELKSPDEIFPAEAIRTAGYGAVWHVEKAWNRVPILQRAGEPVLIRRGVPGDPDGPTGATRAQIFDLHFQGCSDARSCR